MPSPSNGKPVIALRRPPASDPATVERFVAGDPDARTPGRPDASAAPVPRGRGLTRRADGPGMVKRAGGRVRRRRTVYLPPELDRRLTMRCASEGLEASEVVAEALGAWLGDD